MGASRHSVALVLHASVAGGQVTSNVTSRVFLLQSGDNKGSAFTIEVDGQQYVITARHILAKPQSAVDVKLRIGGSWHPFEARTIYPSDDSVDIVALDLGQEVTRKFPLPPTSAGLAIGQQVYFVGFPWGLGSQVSLPDGVIDIAFVKAGVLSAIDFKRKDSVVYFVDGDNNPGFSGGPIVFRDSKNHQFQVAAVVSAYQTEAFPVLKGKDLANKHAKAYNDLYVRGNSGIVVGYGILHIVEAIREKRNQTDGR